MATVLLNIWDRMEKTNAVGWIPVCKIEAESLDTDYLKEEAMKIISRMSIKPIANMARLEVLNNGKKEMKITLTDLW